MDGTTAGATTSAPSASAEVSTPSLTPIETGELQQDVAALSGACSIISSTIAMETPDPQVLTEDNRPEFAALAQQLDDLLQESAAIVDTYADLAGSREARRFFREFAAASRDAGDRWRVAAEAALDDATSLESVRSLNMIAEGAAGATWTEPLSLKPSRFRDVYEATPECPPLL
ncbi:hypothetical protein [Promicromonospora sp. NPDC057488]|uniref:hypothetical protein n=1 Tax=Promicromonospora sp. NPDC057488 TaxID=3346147 RepID=UPI00366EEB4B